MAKSASNTVSAYGRGKRTHPLHVLTRAWHPEAADRENDRVRLQISHRLWLNGLRVMIEAHHIEDGQTAEHVRHPRPGCVRRVRPLQAEDAGPPVRFVPT